MNINYNIFELSNQSCNTQNNFKRIYSARQIESLAMSEFDKSTHQLAGSTNESGGLFVKNAEVFKKPTMPKTSLLGLDALAKQKRKQQEEEQRNNTSSKKLRYEPTREKQQSYISSDLRISFGKSSSSKDRSYRASRVETPSHPGGVSEEALERITSRLRRDQKHAIYASSKEEGKSKKTSAAGEEISAQHERLGSDSIIEGTAERLHTCTCTCKVCMSQGITNGCINLKLCQGLF